MIGLWKPSVWVALIAMAMASPATAQPSPSPADGQPQAAQAPGADAADASEAADAADAPADATDAADAAAQAATLAADPEFQQEFKKRLENFQQKRIELEQAIGRQRAIYVRFLNRDDRSKAAREAYFESRSEVRRLLDETYDAALDVARLAGEEQTAQFLVTMIQHRLEHDIYDLGTLEGATRMIDGGSTLRFLFEAAARSAVSVGQFDLARRLFDVIDDEQMTETDRALQYQLDNFAKAWEKEQPVREQEAAEDRLPRVSLLTTQGEVVIELFIDQAPSTVAHFIKLVEQGFYDGLDFYQVIDHLLALTGDPSGVGSGNSGQFLLDEHDRDDARGAFRGSLVMAKIPRGPQGGFVENSASSQFAILFLPVTAVSGDQTVFGRVVEGMEAISRLRRVDPNKEKEKGEIVLPPDYVIEAKVLRRPETLPEPKYLDLSQPAAAN